MDRHQAEQGPVKYVFEPAVLGDVVRSHADLPLEQKFSSISGELADRYPGLIETNPKWVLSNAGGAMGQAGFLHASLREYLSFFGSPIEVGGHSGRYSFVEQYAFVIHGQMWCFGAGDLKRQEYQPGEWSFLEKRQAKGYRLVSDGWILEYVRGAIPTMLPIAFGDNLFSTLDYATLCRTLGIYTRHSLRTLRRESRK